MKGIYIHIPFCKQKCYYCDFISFANKQNIISQYISAIKKEIRYSIQEQDKIDTIYIGGGTPSIIDSKYIKEILSEINNITEINEKTEITIEVNPGTVNQEKVTDYKKIGINRISIGLQTTNNKLLKTIGRIHSYEQFIEAYKLLKQAGFNNINIDLMLGLPEQTVQDLEESINNVIKLKPKHISIYSLILEEGTKLEKLVNMKKIELPSDELEREMYWKAKKILEQNEYIHYEISNFAQNNYQSKHNSNCWKQQEYYGIGVAAHSYINNIRYSNIEKIEEYIKNIESNEYNKNRQINEIQTKQSKMQEYMILKLRTIDGIQIKEFKNKFYENPLYLYRRKIAKLVNNNLIEVDGDNIKLTPKGLDFANKVWEEFV